MTGLLDVLGERPWWSLPAAVMYAGSITQVGAPPRALLVGTVTDRPDTAFERDKHAGERALLRASAQGAVRGVSVRLPTVFGHNPATGRFDSGVITAMIRRAIAGEALTMWHDGTVRRDLLHVRDAAAALLAALDHVEELAGGHWLAGTGVGTPLGEAFRAVAQIVARRTGTAPVSVVSVPPPRPLSASDVTSAVVDPSSFKNRTGWVARVALLDGLEWTVAAALEAAQTAPGRPDRPRPP
jgi:nucleoside-diphosphate-sugar epimerase